MRRFDLDEATYHACDWPGAIHTTTVFLISYCLLFGRSLLQLKTEKMAERSVRGAKKNTIEWTGTHTFPTLCCI